MCARLQRCCTCIVSEIVTLCGNVDDDSVCTKIRCVSVIFVDEDEEEVEENFVLRNKSLS